MEQDDIEFVNVSEDPEGLIVLKASIDRQLRLNDPEYNKKDYATFISELNLGANIYKKGLYRPDTCAYSIYDLKNEKGITIQKYCFYVISGGTDDFEKEFKNYIENVMSVARLEERTPRDILTKTFDDDLPIIIKQNSIYDIILD